MSDEATIRRFIERESTLGRLVRVFAPRPQLILFDRVHGYALDIQREPHTHRLLAGMSTALAHRLADKMLMEQNEKLFDRFESVTRASAPWHSIPYSGTAYITDPVPETLADFPQPAYVPVKTITIEPKPVKL